MDCKDKVHLFKAIKDIDYGIFMDSGPLHIAKLFKKNGVLIESTVSSEILLSEYTKITTIKNNFSSSYCNSPCGLTDLFNYKGNTGCYNTLKMNQLDMENNNMFQFMNTRGVKNNYEDFINRAVPCLQSLDIQNILNYIKKDLSL